MPKYSEKTWNVVGPWLNGLAAKHGPEGVPDLAEIRAVMDSVEAVHRGVRRRVKGSRKR